MSTCAVVRSFIESKTTEVQTSNVGFTFEVSDYLVVHTGPDRVACERHEEEEEEEVVTLSSRIWMHLGRRVVRLHVCFPSNRLSPMLKCGFESRLGLEFSGLSMWHFLELVVRGFLRVHRFPPLLHRLCFSRWIEANINAMSTLSSWIAELSLRNTWHTTCCRWVAFDVLRVMCTRLRPGHSSVRVGDSSWRSEEMYIVKISNCNYQCDHHHHHF